MRAAFCILFLAALNLSAQVTKDVRAFNVSGIIQEPIMFFRTNIYAGANISITHNANGTITIAGGAGGGTNAIVLTNGVLVGQIGTLNFVSGITGYVSGAEVRLGVDVVSGSGSSVTVASNYVITTPAITNLNFVMGTNIFIVVTNTSGDVSVWINVDKFGITNGLATVSYVDSKGLTTNANQFLGVPLSIINGVLLSNVVNWGDSFVRSNSTTVRTNMTAIQIVTNIIYIGSSASGGHFYYAWDLAAGAYRSVLQGGGSTLIWGTNEHTHEWLGIALRPNLNNTTVLGGSANRWKEGWFGDHLTVSNALRAGYLSISNIPGLGLGYIELRSTNINSYTKFSRLDDNWKPTNYFKFSVTNPVAGQILKFGSVAYSGSGEATIILTNDTDNSGGGGSILFNPNQFFPSATHTNIIDGALLTNIANIGILHVTNPPGSSAKLRIWHTNAQAYTEFTVPDNGWKPTNSFIISVSNMVAGEVLKALAVSYSGGIASIILTNSDATGIKAAGIDSSVQFNESGFFAGTNLLTYNRDAFHLNSANGANSVQLGYSPSGFFTGINSSNTGIGLGVDGISYWNVRRGIDGGNFFPTLSNSYDLGHYLNLPRTNYAATLRAYDRLQIASQVNYTNSISFEVTNTVRSTNILRFAIINPAVGQIFKFDSVQNLAGGDVVITVTNSADNTGGGGGGAFNPNQFSASTLTNLKQYLLVTNPIVYSTNVQSTNLVIQLLSAASGAALSILNSAGAMITEVNSNGFLMITNTLTNYSLGNTRKAPTNTIAIGVDSNTRSSPSWTDDEGLDFAVQTAFNRNRIHIITTGGGATVNFLGVGIAAPAGGTTVSHPAPTVTTPYMVDLATGTTSNNCAAYSSIADLAHAGTHAGSSRMSGYYFATEWMITNNIAGIVGGGATRSFVGLSTLANTAMTNMVVTTNATGQYVGLYSDPKQSLDMYVSARDSGNEFRTNTGINFVATNVYQFYLYQSPTNRFIKWKLRDITARTEALGWFSNSVPTNFMKMMIATKNGTNRAHSIRFSRLYLESALVPR